MNKAVEGLLRSKFGDDAWHKVRIKAGAPDEPFISMENYDDAVTYDLVGAACSVLNLSPETVLEEFGKYWVLYTAEAGYGALMHGAGDTLSVFVKNLDSLHTRVKLSYPNLQPPSFRVTDESANAFTLHYHTHRAGLAPFVVGLLKGLASRFNVSMEIAHTRIEGEVPHDSFVIRWEPIS